jgi:hypothetical protein
MNKINELEELCGEYYKYVYNEMVAEQPEDIEEWLDETFKFAAVNDTFEFYNWYEENEGNPNDLLDLKSTCYLIKHLQKWYEEQYGKDSIMDYEKFTPRYILNNFAYVTLHAMDMEDLKNLLIEEEEEEEEPQCYGKHCSETEGLKPCVGWNRNYCLDNKRFAENLYCDYCENHDCYTNCVWCGEKYKLTDMEYRCGGGFADERAYGNACMFCKGCVDIIEKRLMC